MTDCGCGCGGAGGCGGGFAATGPAGDCGCCAGIAPSTPRAVDNRPGLPAVGYRVGTYADFRASLLAALTDPARPALARLRTRDPDDLSIALLDAVATLADVVTFYSERLANESYLRTALDRTSLQELGRLISYRLRPGVAAGTRLAFQVSPGPTAAAAAATSAFQTLPMPDTVDVPAGQGVRSVPGPGQLPQTFETVEPVTARPAWSAMKPAQTRPAVLGTGSTSVRVAGLSNNLRVGDLLLFSNTVLDLEHWELQPVTAVSTEPVEQRTTLSWASPLGTAPPHQVVAHPRLYAMRKRLSVFGHSAPPFKLLNPDSTASEWPFAISAECGAVDIDGSVPELLVGSLLVLVQGGNRDQFTVTKVEELSRADYAVSGKVTRAWLHGDGNRYFTYFSHVRDTAVYAVSEELTLAAEPDTTPVAHGQLVVQGDVSDLPAGRTVIVAGGGAAEPATVTAAEASTDANGVVTTTLTLAGDLAGSYPRATATVYGNVATATHGQTATQLLGDGDATRAFPAYPVNAAPLTYVRSTDPSGATSTLSVTVNEVTWHEVPTLYPAGPRDRVFVTRDTPSGGIEVAFGDGTRGARLPTGTANVRATYRQGLGTGGNLATGALAQVVDPPLGVTGVTNPVPATGGADPEPVTDARAGIPMAVRTLGRAVSLSDYADYARTFAGVARARAEVLVLPGGRTIVVSVAGPDGDVVTADVLASLVDSLHGHGDPLARVQVVAHRPAPFRLALRVATDPDRDAATVLSGVDGALRAAFGFPARDFGQPVHRSQVVAAAHTVPGVVAVDLDRLYRPVHLLHLPFHHGTLLNERLLPAPAEVAADGTARGAQLLTLADGNLDWLEAM